LPILLGFFGPCFFFIKSKVATLAMVFFLVLVFFFLLLSFFFYYVVIKKKSKKKKTKTRKKPSYPTGLLFLVAPSLFLGDLLCKKKSSPLFTPPSGGKGAATQRGQLKK
jgi:preprotein translocase subunit SecG